MHLFGTRLTIVLGLATAFVFLVLAVRGADFSQVSGTLIESQLRFLPLIVGALMAQFWFKAARWRDLLEPITNTTTGRVYSATVVGYLANLVFPLYIGEFARVYVLGRQLQLPYSPVLATVVLERLFDILSVLFFVSIVLVFDSRAPTEIRVIGSLSGSLSLALTLLLLAIFRWENKILHFVNSFVGHYSRKWAERIANQFQSGLQGVSSLRSLRSLPGIIGASIAQWGMMGICIYFSFLATGLDVPVSAAFVVLALTVMGVTLPSSPGFFGTIQLCFTLGLSPYQIPVSQALATSIVFHVTIYVTGWLAGLYFLRRSNLGLAQLRRAVHRESDRTGSR